MNKIKFIKYSEVKKFVNKNVINIIYGLSEFIKKNHFENINYICDKNEKLWGKKYKNILIIPPRELKNLRNFNLIIWNNHVEKIITSLDNTLTYSKIYIIRDHLQYDIFNISHKYLNNNYNMSTKKVLFKSIVELIEIEPHSYCNRTCWFCPNSFIDRKSEVNYFDKDTLEQLLKDLASIKYNNVISFTRYSEPFGNKAFYSTLKKVNFYLPKAILHANTNGDFLTNDTLELAYKNGLKSLNIQLYLNKKQIFNEEVVNNMMIKVLNKVPNLKCSLDFITTDWIQYKCTYKDMKIQMYARDFKENGTDRSLLDVSKNKNIRTAPCTKVFTDVYIDFNSTVVPCCNIRSDFKEHKNFNFGILRKTKNSIFDIYFSNIAKKWRNHLITTDEKEFDPCRTCNFSSNNNFLISRYSQLIQKKEI